MILSAGTSSAVVVHESEQKRHLSVSFCVPMSCADSAGAQVDANRVLWALQW